MLKSIKIRATSATKNRKGMTLVEVIVATVIAMIVIGLTGGMLISSTNFFGRTADRAEDERIASTILKFTLSELRFATDISADSISSNPPKPVVGRGLLYCMDSSGHRVDKGMIAFKRPFDPDGARNVFGESFYGGRSVAIRMQPLKVDEPKVIRIFVDVYDADNKKVFTDSGTIEIPNVPATRPPSMVMSDEPQNAVLIDYEALPDRFASPAAITP